MMIGRLFRDLLGAFGCHKCPQCGSARIDVKRVRRSLGQHDGLDGYAYTCRDCSFKWVKPLKPVV